MKFLRIILLINFLMFYIFIEFGLSYNNKKSIGQIRKNIIKGFIKDIANGETISYVNIVLDGTTIGAMSDERYCFAE